VKKKEKARSLLPTLEKKGRITLPKEVRDALVIVEGCLVRCKVVKVKSRK
jgi:AbrB family looped-hinge helix DNA binding protein